VTPALAQRVLALPDDVRATLATVPGPGWRISAFGAPPVLKLRYTGTGWTWWPANPAAAVAACMAPMSLTAAYSMLVRELLDGADDDHAAALSIIEAHVARGAK